MIRISIRYFSQLDRFDTVLFGLDSGPAPLSQIWTRVHVFFSPIFRITHSDPTHCFAHIWYFLKSLFWLILWQITEACIEIILSYSQVPVIYTCIAFLNYGEKPYLTQRDPFPFLNCSCYERVGGRSLIGNRLQFLSSWFKNLHHNSCSWKLEWAFSVPGYD